jgi:hypothetical protein
MDYQEKYLKYKLKYLTLKKQIGSGSKNGVTQGPPFDHEIKMYFYVLLGDGSGKPENRTTIVSANDGRFYNGHVAIGMDLSAEEIAEINAKPNKNRIIEGKMPIVGLGPILPSEIYAPKEEGGVQKLFLTGLGESSEFWGEFKRKSYESSNIEEKFDLRTYYDTKLFHIEEADLANINKEKQKNRKIYKFEVYTEKGNAKRIFKDLLERSLDKTSANTLTPVNQAGKPLKYGILLKQEKCYGTPEFGPGQSVMAADGQTDKYEVFNCITSIFNFFNPYVYRKDIVGGKVMYSRVYLSNYGTERCARIRYLGLHLINTVEEYEVITPVNSREGYKKVRNEKKYNCSIGLDTI